MIKNYILTLSFLFAILICMGQNADLKKELKFYPNPVVNGQLNLNFGSWSSGYEHLEIYDLTGLKVFEATLNTKIESKYKLDLSVLPIGNYFLLIKAESEVFSTRLTIN